MQNQSIGQKSFEKTFTFADANAQVDFSFESTLPIESFGEQTKKDFSFELNNNNNNNNNTEKTPVVPQQEEEHRCAKQPRSRQEVERHLEPRKLIFDQPTDQPTDQQLVRDIISENERLLRENERLCIENSLLKRDNETERAFFELSQKQAAQQRNIALKEIEGLVSEKEKLQYQLRLANDQLQQLRDASARNAEQLREREKHNDATTKTVSVEKTRLELEQKLRLQQGQQKQPQYQQQQQKQHQPVQPQYQQQQYQQQQQVRNSDLFVGTVGEFFEQDQRTRERKQKVDKEHELQLDEESRRLAIEQLQRTQAFMNNLHANGNRKARGF